MPVFEQGYRRYVGERRTGSRALTIAWENIRPRMRWWCWALLFVILIWPYIVMGVAVFLATVGNSLFGTGGPGFGRAFPAPTVAFQQTQADPTRVLGVLNGNSLALYWMLLDTFSFKSVVFPGVVCAGLLASDRRTGALQIYFSRPVTRLDYLLGKALAATFFVSLVTAIPCLVVWLECLVFGSTANLTWKAAVAPFAILGSSAFYAFWTVSLVLALSSVLRRPVFVAILTIVVNFVLEGVGEVLARALREKGLGKGWHVIQPSYAIGSMSAPLCGLSLPDWLPAPLAIGIALGVPTLLLLFVWSRLRAVEVAT